VSGIAIDGNDTLYAADSESTPRSHPGWLKGIRIGSLKDGKVTIFVPPHKTDAPDGAMEKDRHRYRRQSVHRGSHREGRDEVRQGLGHKA